MLKTQFPGVAVVLVGEIGRVVEMLEGGAVSVRLPRSPACKHCRACFASENGEMIMEATNACGAGVGDYVRVELKDGVFIRAALTLYGIPCAFMLAGFLIGDYIGRGVGIPDWACSFGLGAAGLFGSYFVIKAVTKMSWTESARPMAAEVVRGDV